MVDKTVPASPSLQEVAILLDVDGTILDLAPTPGGVSAPESLGATLARLSQRSGGALALVSGRPLDDLDLIFSPLQLPAIGGHGAEIRVSPGSPVDRSNAAQLDGRLKRRLAAIAAEASGIIVEDKGYSLALHYRLAPEMEGAVKRAVATIQADWPANAIEVLRGKAVIEIKPVGFDKGTAVRRLMTHPPFAGRRPIFIGDDTTDETAFAVLPEFGGIGFSVGRIVPGTTHCFENPGEVRGWLARVAAGYGLQAS